MKDKIITYTFLIYIFLFLFLHILLKDNEISFSERRKLSEFPSFSLTSEYITKVDKYLLDHFPYRDGFRSLKANFNYNILNKLDNNGIFLKDNYVYKSDYPTNKDSVNNFVTKINGLIDGFSKNNNVYMMIVPDKNYYLNDKDFLQIDYNYIYNDVKNIKATNIDIRNILNISDYYMTDTHWRQENILKVVHYISDYLKFNYYEEDYTYNKYDKFYGVYYGESAIEREAEELIYLTSDSINSVSVKYLENDKLTSIYNVENLEGIDAYSVYLDGASSFIEIYNENVKNDKELVIFRDSFGSSFAPLLINYYSKITIIDNRYINSASYNELINFDNQDILFLYSTMLINNSSTLKG